MDQTAVSQINQCQDSPKTILFISHRFDDDILLKHQSTQSIISILSVILIRHPLVPKLRSINSGQTDHISICQSQGIAVIDISDRLRLSTQRQNGSRLQQTTAQNKYKQKGPEGPFATISKGVASFHSRNEAADCERGDEACAKLLPRSDGYVPW